MSTDIVVEGEYRIEHDTMGEVRVPVAALYRAQTQRAVENFPISGSGLEAAQIIALARIKRAAAVVNGSLGVVDQDPFANRIEGLLPNLLSCGYRFDQPFAVDDDRRHFRQVL